MRVVEPQASVHRQPAERRTVLHVRGLLRHHELVPPVVVAHGEPVRHAVVEPELQETVLLRRVRPHLVKPLAVEADLETVGAGDIGSRPDPADQPSAIDAEVPCAIRQPRNGAALFVDLHERPALRRGRFAIETVRIPDAHLDEELVGQGRRPVELLHAPVSRQSRDIAW